MRLISKCLFFQFRKVLSRYVFVLYGRSGSIFTNTTNFEIGSQALVLISIINFYLFVHFMCSLKEFCKWLKMTNDVDLCLTSVLSQN